MGTVLAFLKAMAVLDNTIIWLLDRQRTGARRGRMHGGTTPFRGEKMTTYEGGVRVPI